MCVVVEWIGDGVVVVWVDFVGYEVLCVDELFVKLVGEYVGFW